MPARACQGPPGCEAYVRKLTVPSPSSPFNHQLTVMFSSPAVCNCQLASLESAFSCLQISDLVFGNLPDCY